MGEVDSTSAARVGIVVVCDDCRQFGSSLLVTDLTQEIYLFAQGHFAEDTDAIELRYPHSESPFYELVSAETTSPD